MLIDPTLRYWHFDDAGYYTGDTQVDYHPVETDVVMPAPYNATLEPITKPFPERKWPKRVGDAWVMVDSYIGVDYWIISEDELEITGYTVLEHEAVPPQNALFARPEKTIAMLKVERRNALEGDYRTANTQDIRYESEGGVIRLFQTNVTSLDSLAQALSAYSYNESVPAGYFWRSSDNFNVPFTYVDLQQLNLAIETRQFSYFTELTSLKDFLFSEDVETAEDISEVIWVTPE